MHMIYCIADSDKMFVVFVVETLSTNILPTTFSMHVLNYSMQLIQSS